MDLIVLFVRTSQMTSRIDVGRIRDDYRREIISIDGWYYLGRMIYHIDWM